MDVDELIFGSLAPLDLSPQEEAHALENLKLLLIQFGALGAPDLPQVHDDYQRWLRQQSWFS